MEIKRFRPAIGKMFWAICIPTVALLAAATALSVVSLAAFLIIRFTDLLTVYFLITSLFGYVELRENSVFIKFGFVMKKEIPYDKIRGITKERKFYSDSMNSLKNTLEHVNIKYNTFDLVSVSVTDNDALIRELKARRLNNT